MTATTFRSTELFGGAMLADLPSGFMDARSVSSDPKLVDSPLYLLFKPSTHVNKRLSGISTQCSAASTSITFRWSFHDFVQRSLLLWTRSGRLYARCNFNIDKLHLQRSPPDPRPPGSLPRQGRLHEHHLRHSGTGRLRRQRRRGAEVSPRGHDRLRRASSSLIVRKRQVVVSRVRAVLQKSN